MYSRKSWGGDTDPFILTKFLAYEAEDEANKKATTGSDSLDDRCGVSREVLAPGGTSLTFLGHQIIYWPRDLNYVAFKKRLAVGDTLLSSRPPTD